RAQLQHRGRGPDVALSRRLAAPGEEDGSKARGSRGARFAGARDRTTLPRRDGSLREARRGGEAGDRRDSTRADQADFVSARACPVGIPDLGTLVAHGPAIRKPVHRVHWAGTETSTYWMGYMDGAVRSGERAATEVLDRL